MCEVYDICAKSGAFSPYCSYLSIVKKNFVQLLPHSYKSEKYSKQFVKITISVTFYAFSVFKIHFHSQESLSFAEGEAYAASAWFGWATKR